MHSTSLIIRSVWLTALSALLPAAVAGTEFSLPELQQKLKSIDEELEQLADYNLRSGTGPVGYASKAFEQFDQKVWVRIELGATYSIDQVVLVPMIWRDPHNGLQAEGFPTAFRILTGSGNTTNEVATFSEKDNLLPRIAPLAVSFSPVNVSWIQVETSRLSPRGWDDKYALHLAEILVFSEQENVAINKSVSASSSRLMNHLNKKILVDGFVPYLMDSSQGSESHPVTFSTNDEFLQPAITIDLKESYPINQLNLHMTHIGSSIPDGAPSDYSVPRHLRVMGANRPDFSDQTLLFEYRNKSVYDIGPILVRRFSETTCRYVRVQMLKLHSNFGVTRYLFSASFFEIEVFSRGRNIARGKPVSSSETLPLRRVLARMTNGNNLFGEILTIRNWMNQLARRHDLGIKRPQVETELNLRYAHQKAKLNRMSWLAVLLGSGIIITILIDRMLRMRQVTKIRKRFAADLHDELGADLHTIGLLSDMAAEMRDNPNKLDKCLRQIRTSTEKTGEAVHLFSNLQESGFLGHELSTELRRNTERIVPHLEYILTLEGENWLNQLHPREQTDLFLFYKECLINICRHSEATRLETHLVASQKKILLTITDNGTGLEQVPPSLKRRARLLRAKVTTDRPEEGGTRIILRFRIRRRLRKSTKPDTPSPQKGLNESKS
jgi:signal transduction histidine kinase